ncbi:collagen alpha-1(VIII) chain-like [Sinocyclocheilus anshuiensis]|uniref:collagen alpha-1(VIII) chain-like n=1 Tax=Sinocyclocheilus anshuiensis TaxID=1608454 RepID=UPI0007B80221|nr:PREDICTED: collagen alpha-1(VIII) chain-like [Sinocyclocheilus anshuiensis]
MPRNILYSLLLLLFSCDLRAEGTEHLNVKKRRAVSTPGEFQTHILTGIQSELAELKSTVSSLKTKLQVTEEQLKQLRRNEFKVAFGATLGSTGNFGPFNSPVTLVYNNVYVNEGSAYNPNTGIFTAPVKGAYFFSFSGHNCSSKVLNLGLFKNGEQMVIVFNHPLGDHYESTANSVSLTLEKGDRVYVRLRETSWVFDNYSHHNSFVGHLLFPL